MKRGNLQFDGPRRLAARRAVAGHPQMAKELHVRREWSDAVNIDAHGREERLQGDRESPGGLAKLRAMVESGNITSTLSSRDRESSSRPQLGLIEPLDWAKIDPHPMYEEAKDEFGIGTNYFSTVMAWRERREGAVQLGRVLRHRNFPGKRACRTMPASSCRSPFSATGVPVEKLFPLDLDRAYKTLNRIKADTIWWKAGAQPPQLLKDNEAQYVISWSGRVVGEEGITISFKDGMLDTVLVRRRQGRRSRREGGGVELAARADRRQDAGLLAQYISYTGPSPDLDALLPQDKLDQFPTTSANKKVQWFENAQWWHENAEAVQKKWEEFKLDVVHVSIRVAPSRGRVRALTQVIRVDAS